MAAAADGPIPVYHRDEFGTGWVLVRGHCDTREIVLERDAGTRAVDTDGDGCRDDAPIHDLYTDRDVNPAQADVDHVVALGDAWYSGAYLWTAEQRRIFSQDQANLRAVGASINRAKGDLGPDQWTPPARSGACGYAMIYQSTKQRWRLVITAAQRTALNTMLGTCPTHTGIR